MSVRTDVLLGLTLAAAIAFGLLLAVAGGESPVQATDTRTSTLVSTAEGSQAVYETLAELGVPVRRRRTALFTLSDEQPAPGALAVVAPRRPMLGSELAEVVRYLRRGGTVIAVGEASGFTRCVGFAAPRADSGSVVDGMFGSIGRELAVRPDAPLRLPLVRRVLGRWRPSKESADAERRFLEESGCTALAAPRRDTLLAARDGRPVIIELRYAPAGRVVLIAEPGYFRNRAWRDTDVAQLLVPLLVPQRRGPLVWDEYHHGFAAESGARAALWAWVRGTPIGWALLQLAAVALVWLAVKAVRFGPALAVIERRRRSPLEHVEALARGLEGAGGAQVAVDLIVSGLRRRLSRAGHPAQGDVGAWLGALELALPSAGGRAAARTLLRLRDEPGGAERVLAAAQAVEDVWQDLRPRSSPAAS
jgi:hypothetical protein